MRQLLCAIAAVLILIPTLVSGQRGASDQRPSFEGIWNSATTTPLERPRELKEKAFFTLAEAEQWDRAFAKRNEEPAPGPARAGGGTGTITPSTASGARAA